VQDALTPIVDRMLALLPLHPEQLVWEPARAIRHHFPCVAVMPLPAATPFVSDQCACDGYYERDLDPERPWIFYRGDVAVERVRFTLLHELGHHLIWDVEPSLLDLIDAAAGATGAANELEEQVCHRFAARLLISDTLLHNVVGGAVPTVSHLQALRQLTPASWQAAAIRLAHQLRTPGAIVLIRSPGRVAFVATSPHLYGRWPRSSPVAPGGALARALQRPTVNAREPFAWNLPDERLLWCTVRMIHDRLAIAMMTSTPVPPQADGPGASFALDDATDWISSDDGPDEEGPVSLGVAISELLDGPAPPRRRLPARPHAGDPADEAYRRPLASLGQVRSSLRPGTLTLIASRPGQGKSALALGLGVDMALTHRMPVAIACLEQTETELGMRLLAADAGVAMVRLRTGTLEEADWHRLLLSVKRLARAPIRVISTRCGLSLADLTDRCLALQRQRSIGLLVVDYIQLLTAEPDAPASFCDPHTAVARLKHLAIELEIAVIAVSQVGRGVAERPDQRPELTDLTEHRAASRVTDLVALLHTQERTPPTAVSGRPAELIIAHHRLGPTGVLQLRFEDRCCRFRDIRPPGRPPPARPGPDRQDERGLPSSPQRTHRRPRPLKESGSPQPNL
jgi:hypothetical protein